MSKAERTRQFIIEQSSPLFNTKGINSTSISDITTATKMAKGSLYVHFENKDELSYAVVDYTLNKLVDYVNTGIRRAKTRKDQLFAYLNAIRDTLNPPISGGCPILNFGMEADDTNDQICKLIHQTIEQSKQGISHIISQGIANGEFQSTWNADEFAVKMFAMMEGGIMMSRVAGNNQSIDMIVRILQREIEEQTC
jgi:TetR/AcrR family transcriptional repressor of nem operon